MSLKKNIVASCINNMYATVIGIVMVPLYIKYMGAEAFGLVGFFSMLQVWFTLLDMGFTATMARETARFRGGALDAITFRRFVRALEIIFLFVALVGGGILLLLSHQIATNWLTAKQLPIAEVQRSIQMMVVAIIFRWMSGLYRGQITGSEKLVWLSGYNMVIATLRFIGVLPVFIFISVTPTAFFSYQLCVAVIELAGLMFISYRLLPAISEDEKVAWSWAPLKPVLNFSLSIAFSSLLWALITQTDKLVLSTVLPLAEYGYFALAVLVASSISLIRAPIRAALLPRMTKMNAEGNETGLITLYRDATQLVAIIAIPAALILAFFAEQVLWAWTGNAEIARKSAPVLAFYALGNGILAIGSLCYFLQFAKGDLKLNVIETLLFIAVFIPSLLWLTTKYGFLGPGYAWLGTEVIFFLLWVPVIHRRFLKGMHFTWLVHDIGVVFILSLCALLLSYFVVINGIGWPIGRMPVALTISLLGVITMTVPAIGSRFGRKIIRRQLGIYFNV